MYFLQFFPKNPSRAGNFISKVLLLSIMALMLATGLAQTTVTYNFDQSGELFESFKALGDDKYKEGVGFNESNGVTASNSVEEGVRICTKPFDNTFEGTRYEISIDFQFQIDSQKPLNLGNPLYIGLTTLPEGEISLSNDCMGDFLFTMLERVDTNDQSCLVAFVSRNSAGGWAGDKTAEFQLQDQEWYRLYLTYRIQGNRLDCSYGVRKLLPDGNPGDRIAVGSKSVSNPALITSTTHAFFGSQMLARQRGVGPLDNFSISTEQTAANQ